MREPDPPAAADVAPYEPLPGQGGKVEAMAGYGVPEADIALVVGITPETLRQHFGTELDSGDVKVNAKVAENLYRKATGEGREAVTAAIFWLKTRAGWRETSVHEIGGSRDLGPVQIDRIVRVIVDPADESHGGTPD